MPYGAPLSSVDVMTATPVGNVPMTEVNLLGSKFNGTSRFDGTY